MPSRRPAGQVVNPRGDTAERIEATAVDLIFTEGFPKTSIREITAELGLTPGAFYNHFGSKEELLLAIITKTHSAIEATIENALLAAGDDPVRQLGEVVRGLTRFYTRSQKEATISQRESRRLPGDEPAKMLASERRIRRTVERILARGLAAEQFSLMLPGGRRADIGVTAKAILDQIVSAGVWFRPSGPLDEEALAQHYAGLILRMAGVDVEKLTGEFTPA